MMFVRRLFAAVLLCALATVTGTGARAAGPVKIGLVTTLSTPLGYTGQDVRDGFMLAVDEEGGKLGGVPVKVTVEDDGLKPATGREIADRFLQQEKMHIITGTVFSNVMGAVVPDVVGGNAIFVSPNAGSSVFAGEKCNKNLFVVSFQNDTANIPAGVYSNTHAYTKMVLMAADYVAGHDMVNGFMVGYKGSPTQIFPKLEQTDFSAEIARIRSLDPQAVFYFMPGGPGIDFLKQYRAAGVKAPLLATIFSLDEQILAAVGDAAKGMQLVGHYSIDFPNAANKRFVADFEKKYHRKPTLYAADAYDSAHAIGSGLKAAKGDDANLDAVREGIRKADFASVRGSFKFGPNQYPVQTWYAMSVEPGKDGKLAIVTKQPILRNYGDPFAAKCKM